MSKACCRCGAAQQNAGSHCLRGALSHCFCCNKPPPMKCLHCGVLRDIPLDANHETCVDESAHYYIYSEQWPPFPSTEAETIFHTHSSQPVETGGHTLCITDARTLEEEPIEIADDPQEATENYAEDDDESERKPSVISWVTTKEIRGWKQCPRCKRHRTTNLGWVQHAQKCAQDPAYKRTKFFIYTHTKGWCNYLVKNSQWDRHSNPVVGVGQCTTCSAARREGLPMPFMPDPPPRPNEDYLAKMRRRRAARNRKMGTERYKRTNARVPGNNAPQMSPGSNMCRNDHRTSRTQTSPRTPTTSRIPTAPNAFCTSTGSDTTIWLGTNIGRATAMRLLSTDERD
ncbi:uncharacterized protein LOC108030942 [Drosophila biarmipes]|uniref:uncharacterized protein LOC108030942 n=1 Tax=Drosophila biarmipes TaxID=125945 RepID=UPI0007E716DF|nr:uncharacterized protein LOC108030942 [Drosophila biarmipes]XP_016959638.1 uncharacterized protein LOC108030942 [Drosophila biarmipes]XP_043951035.1 uncharacterized protein LOC108030942 [Drosophila biarmipes]